MPLATRGRNTHVDSSEVRVQGGRVRTRMRCGSKAFQRFPYIESIDNEPVGGRHRFGTYRKKLSMTQ